MTEDSKEIIDIMQGIYKNLSSDIGSIKSDIGNIKEELKAVREENSELKLILENVVHKDIQLLVEGYTVQTEKNTKIDLLSEDMVKVKSDISVIKDVVTGHSDKINKLSKVK